MSASTAAAAVYDIVPDRIAQSIVMFGLVHWIPVVAWEWRMVVALSALHLTPPETIRGRYWIVVATVMRLVCGFIPVPYVACAVAVLVFYATNTYAVPNLESIQYTLALAVVVAGHFTIRGFISGGDGVFVAAAVVSLVVGALVGHMFRSHESPHLRMSLQITIAVSVRALGFAAPTFQSSVAVWAMYTLLYVLPRGIRSDPIRSRPYTSFAEIACALSLAASPGIVQLAKWPAAVALDCAHAWALHTNPHVELEVLHVPDCYELMYLVQVVAFSLLFARDV